MPDRQFRKDLMRKTLRLRRKRLSRSAQLTAAEAVTNRVTELPGWPAFRRIALYLANDGEVDTKPLSTGCRAAGKQLFLPVIDAGKMLHFAEWADGDKLLANRFGIPEPPPAATRCDARELDVVVLPLVAWDRRGGRLGMGGGFYDRTLAGVEGPLLVGLAHSLQEVPAVPRDDWDVSLDFVVTDTALHQCRVRN